MDLDKRNPTELNMPLRFRLVNGHPVVAQCNERIVEIPFVHRALPSPFRGRVLDVGCRESQLCFEVSCLGFETWAIDIRPQPIRFPGVHYVQADICRDPFTSAVFDVIIACSTIEHIGLLTYGNEELNPEGDSLAIMAIYRLLKTEGRLILTVPFGRPGATDWYRVYDYESLHKLLSPNIFKIQKEGFWLKDNLCWISGSWQEAEQVDSLSQGACAVACVVVRPT